MRIAIVAVIVLAGCSSSTPAPTPTPPAEPQKLVIEIKPEDPLLAAAVAEGVQQARDGAQWIKQANDEQERLLNEYLAVSEAGYIFYYQPADSAYQAIRREYERRQDADGWPAAAEWFVGQVEGNRLADFHPDQEQAAADWLAKAKGIQDKAIARSRFERIAADFAKTKAGAEARELLGE
jgi:hypothetical protein